MTTKQILVPVEFVLTVPKDFDADNLFLNFDYSQIIDGIKAEFDIEADIVTHETQVPFEIEGDVVNQLL